MAQPVPTSRKVWRFYFGALCATGAVQSRVCGSGNQKALRLARGRAGTSSIALLKKFTGDVELKINNKSKPGERAPPTIAPMEGGEVCQKPGRSSSRRRSQRQNPDQKRT